MAKKIGNITIYSVMELSKELNITKTTIRAYIRDGKLKGRKAGGRYYVTEDSLYQFLKGEGEGEGDKKARVKI